MVRPPLCGMIATGQKQIENLAIRDWVAWGSQGYLVVAFYQGSKILKDLDKYVPPKNRLAPLAREDNGNILAVGILGPAETPTHPSDEGWFHEVTPMGMNASMHRIVGLWRPATPYTPVNSYHLGGGLMLLHATDMHRLCHLMAEQVLAHPCDALFEATSPQRLVRTQWQGFTPYSIASPRMIPRMLSSPHTMVSSAEGKIPVCPGFPESINETQLQYE